MAEQGYGFSRQAARRIAQVVRRVERTPRSAPPAVRPLGRGEAPLLKGYLDTGQSLSGSSPATPADFVVYSGAPGSEAATPLTFPVYGSLLDSGQTIDDSVLVFVAVVDGRWEVLITAVESGTGSGGGTITVELPSALARTDGTKASCTVKATFAGGPAIDDTVTITNPPASGGDYQFAAGTDQYVNATFQGGSTYLIVSVQPLVRTVVENVDWTSPNLTQDLADHHVSFAENERSEPILTGVTKECPEDQ